MLFVAHSMTNQRFRKARHKTIQTCRDASRTPVGLGWVAELERWTTPSDVESSPDKSARHTPLTDTDDVIGQMILRHQMLGKHLMAQQRHLKGRLAVR